jgi:hypothetical protein
MAAVLEKMPQKHGASRLVAHQQLSQATGDQYRNEFCNNFTIAFQL